MANIDVNFESKSIGTRLLATDEVSRVADQNYVVRLPNPKKEQSLKEDKNQSLRSSQGKLRRKTKKGKVTRSLMPIILFFERKTLVG